MQIYKIIRKLGTLFKVLHLIFSSAPFIQPQINASFLTFAIQMIHVYGFAVAFKNK